MSVVAVSGNYMVIVSQERNRADGDSFLAGVEVKEAPHFAQVIIFKRGLFEASDPEHLAQETNFLVLR